MMAVVKDERLQAKEGLYDLRKVWIVAVSAQKESIA